MWTIEESRAKQASLFSLSDGGDSIRRAGVVALSRQHSRATAPAQSCGFLKSADGFYTIYPVWRVQLREGKITDVSFGSMGLEFQDEEGRAAAGASLMDCSELHLAKALQIN